MSIHDWSSRWFHHHGDEARTEPADVESDHDSSALGEALDRRDAEVTPLFARRPEQWESETGVPAQSVARPSQRELDPEPDTGLNQDLAALSRVILNLPAESTDAQPAPSRGTRVRLDAVPDEAPLVPTGVVGGARARREPVAEQPPAPTIGAEPTSSSRAGARARRDVPPLVGAPAPGEVVVSRGKHAATWADETPEVVVESAELAETEEPATWADGALPADAADFDWPVLDSFAIPEEVEAPPAPPAPLEWNAPAVPFELEPEPEVDLEPLRWAEALDVDATDEPVEAPVVEAAIESADDVFRWTAAEMELPLEVPDLTSGAVPEPAPEPEPVVLAKPEPEPAPPVAWDSMAVAPKVPAARPVQSSAALLRELSFLD